MVVIASEVEVEEKPKLGAWRRRPKWFGLSECVGAPRKVRTRAGGLHQAGSSAVALCLRGSGPLADIRRVSPG